MRGQGFCFSQVDTCYPVLQCKVRRQELGLGSVGRAVTSRAGWLVGWLVTFTTAMGPAVISSTPELQALIPFHPLFAIQPTHTGIFSQEIGIGIRQGKCRQIFLQNVINR